MLKPTDLKQVTEAIQQAGSERKSLYLHGTGTKSSLHEKADAELQMSLCDYQGVVDYDPEELVLVVKSGTALQTVKTLLDSRQQMLAFEPPDFTHLLQQPHSGTIGGVVASNLSGSRRLSAGAARDYLLGFDAVSGRGEGFKSGSRVMKNVTGYDLSKLMCGSYGTLAVMGEITLKVLPKPETSKTLKLTADSVKDAQSALAAAFRTATEPSGGAIICDADGVHALIRLEGVNVSVSDRLTALSNALAHVKSASQILEQDVSEQIWTQITNAELFSARAGDIWKCSIIPNQLDGFIQAVQRTGEVEFIADWAGGLVWIGCISQDVSTHIRNLIAQHGGGHAHLVRSQNTHSLPVFQPYSPAVAQLQKRIKSAFDPLAILNPAIMGLSETQQAVS